jgi:Na+/melibiose symporter-like transporter
MSLPSPVGGTRVQELLANRDLCLLLFAGLVSQTGNWAVDTGIAFEVYVLTHSTLASATALLATQLPQVVLGSIAGVLVDRADRRRLMVAVNVALSVLILPLAAVRHSDQIWVVCAVVAASSCLTPFFTAAEASLLPALVDRPGTLVTANALNGQVANVARLIGAAAGGVLVAAGGLVLLAVTDAASFLVAAGAIALIGHRPEPVVRQHLRLIRDWTDGLAVIRRSRALGVLVFFFAVSGVGEAVMRTLFAPFVDDVLGGTARAYGFILAVQAVGGIIGGVLVTAVGHRFTPRALFGWGAVVFGALDLSFSCIRCGSAGCGRRW